MISFAVPIALALAGLALPILILYILKVRLRKIPVSTNLFWKQIYEEKPPRSIWQNLRHWLSLLMQWLLLALLVFAIADPFLPWQLKKARRVVLIMDNSASMQAADGSSDRLTTAKSRANRFIDGLRENDQAAILIADQPPKVVIGMTGHIPSLRQAIESIPASDNETRVESAIELGKKLISDHPNGSIVIYSDGMPPKVDPPKLIDQADVTAPIASIAASIPSEPSVAPKKNAEPEVAWDIVGSIANNVAITQLQARRSLSDMIGYEILVTVLNASSESVQCRLELSLEDAPIDVVPLKLAAGEKWSQSFEKTSLSGGKLVAKLIAIRQQDDTAVEETKAQADKADKSDSASTLNALLVDDEAAAMLPSRSIQQVLIVSPGNMFLQKAFAANPLVELTVVDKIPEPIPTDKLIVFHQLVPSELPNANVLIVDPEADSNLWKLGPSIENPIITEQDETSPLMRHLKFDNVIVPDAKKIEFATPPRVLASTVTDDCILAELKRPSHRGVLLNVDLETSDLAFRTAFPIFVTNFLAWTANQLEDLQPAMKTGATLTVDLTDVSTASTMPSASVPAPTIPARSASEGNTGQLASTPLSNGTTAFDLQSPDGTRTAINLSRLNNEDGSLRSISTTLGPFDNVGVWNVVSIDSTSPETSSSDSSIQVLKSIAVNLASEAESNLRTQSHIDDARMTASVIGGLFSRPLWFYLAMVAAICFVVEWFLYQRRFIS
jgi:hypothetical protein